MQQMKLTVDKINKSYGNHTVLNNVSFTMDNGVYGLLGSNGAGKTTLINIIVRLIGQDSGAIICDDVDVTKLGGEYFNRIGYLPQYPRLYKNFTAVEFLKYMAELKGLKKSESSSRIDELLELVNLTADKDKKIGAAVTFGNPKSRFASGESGFDSVSLAPERAMNSASIIKGKSDGITTSPHTEMPLRIPAEISAPKTNKSAIAAIEKQAIIIRLSIKITTKIYAPAYFYSHLLITFGIRNQLAYSG